MKTKITFLISFLAAVSFGTLQAQVLLAKWTFPTGNASDSLADGGLPVNLTKAIRTEGGTSAIDFSKNGLTTKAAQTTGWENGAMTKCWIIQISTFGYENLSLSSKQQSGGNSPGPKDYKVQYRIGASGSWTDVPNSTMVTANNWTSASLDYIDLPVECKNQASLYLRWLSISDISSSGGTLVSTGLNKIDDIYIYGELIVTSIPDQEKPAVCKVFPNPTAGPVTITSTELISSLEVLNLSGIQMDQENCVNSREFSLDFSKFPAGSYFVRLRTISGKTMLKPLVIR